MNTIHVSASRGYDVLVQPGILRETGRYVAALTRAGTAALIADETVYPLYGGVVEDSLRAAGLRVVSFVYRGGERAKNLATYGEILNFLAENRLSRSDVVVALGGGVTGDMAGFAAATYLRGVDFVQLPTTLLAAVDSSVGGKTAVDLPAGKNLAGAFCQPVLVLCDPETLRTLPEEQFRAGCAEVIKYGVLGNEPFFRELEQTPVAEQLEHVISVCVGMKRDIVDEDEFDRGQRRLLNLGHTVGHAVEACSDFSIAHGEAVAIGMAVITRAAVKRGVCGEETLTRLLALLRRCGLPTETERGAEELYRAALSDKKMAEGKMHLVVPEAIGRCRVESIAAEEMLSWLRDGGLR
ncbi:MAG: 3-dehydroquinate synthase [Oscillospiraceae bacterium]